MLRESGLNIISAENLTDAAKQVVKVAAWVF
jgi:succinyl-CoA synthetase beta subunit